MEIENDFPNHLPKQVAHIKKYAANIDTDDLGDTWYVVGIGTNIQFADNTQFYFDAEKSFCADVDMKYRFNAGIRFEF